MSKDEDEDDMFVTCVTCGTKVPVRDGLVNHEKMDALREALDAMVNCPVGGSGQRLPAPEVVAFARAVLRGKGEK